MAARDSKSKKDSAANSRSASPPESQPTFLLDKCLGNYDVAEALRAIGANVEIHLDHFAHDALDSAWLHEVGRRGWIVLTKDRRILSNSLEVIALLESNTHTFVLSAANMSGQDMAASFTAAHEQMLKLIQKFPPPCVSRVTRAGKVSVLATHDDLIGRVADHLDD